MTQKVSIIVPCYNQEAYMDKCFQSVVSQNFVDWECIIVDDGSQDQTAEIGKKWENKDSRFKYFYKVNGGLSSARNFGMDKATGEFIFFLDSDDSLADNQSLEYFASKIDNNVDVITANINNEFSDGSIIPSKLGKPNTEIFHIKKEEVFKFYLNEKISVVAWNKLYRRSFIEENQLKFKDGLLHEDELWSLQLYLIAEDIIILPDFTYNYFQGNPNSITAKKGDKNYDSLVFIMVQITEYLKTEQKLQQADKKSVVRLFEKQYYFLKNPAVVADKKLWIKKYTEIQKIYKNSILNSYQKRFVYPAGFSHLALRRLQNDKNMNQTLKSFFSKFITF